MNSSNSYNFSIWQCYITSSKFFVCSILLLIQICSIMLFLSCKQSRQEWPINTGYMSYPKNRPSSPHKVKETLTKVEIIAVSNGQFLFSENSEFEYRESEALFIFPGALLTYLAETPRTLEINDYNGDECLLPRGITVKVDKYGHFVPIKYNPPRPRKD